jgi:hypothetical protein
LSLPQPAAAQDQAAVADMEHLGGERYRIGEIMVDREAHQLVVPGKVLHLDDTLEYLAVARNGHKAYESLLELSTTPREFNLACILIGLDDASSVKPRYQFDETKLAGPTVAVTIEWTMDGETRTSTGANALQVGDTPFDDDSWVYIGSDTSQDGRNFAADMSGALIGFVHDPTSIIEHVNGAGIGDYGLITGNDDALPAEGDPVMLTVKVIGDTSTE